MKTSFRAPSLTLFAVFLGVMGVIATTGMIFASLARADSGPTVSVVVHNGSNVVVTTAPIGTALSASTTVASSTASTVPTGTVSFNLYTNTTCSSTPTTQSGVALVNGTAQSATTTITAAGLSYTVNYSGDASNTPSVSQCVAVLPTSSTVAVATTLSTTTSVLVGSTVSDSATLSGVTNTASGTVAYKVYTDNACTLNAQSAGVVTVTNGIVPNSSALPFNTAGTYYWQVVYSGDTHNAAATSTCGSEVLTVTTTPVVPPVTGTGSISGTVFNDLNKDYALTSGEPGIAGFTINLHSGTSNGGAVVATVTTNASGVYTFPNLAFGTYYVEEVNLAGWKQTTSDAAVTISTTTPAGTLNFANGTATSTPKGKGKGKGHEFNFFGHHFNFSGHQDKDDNKGSKGDKVTPVKAAPVVQPKAQHGWHW